MVNSQGGARHCTLRRLPLDWSVPHTARVPTAPTPPAPSTALPVLLPLLTLPSTTAVTPPRHPARSHLTERHLYSGARASKSASGEVYAAFAHQFRNGIQEGAIKRSLRRLKVPPNDSRRGAFAGS